MGRKKTYCRDFIKERDIFGHAVQLNFDATGGTHTTLLGGWFSTLLFSFAFMYLSIITKKILGGGDQISSNEFMLTGEELQHSVTYKDTHLMVTPVIINHANNQIPYLYDDEAKKHIEIRFT